MARYRLLFPQFRCDNEHTFDTTMRYEYTEKTTEYQVKRDNPDLRSGTWNDPWHKFPVCPECGAIVVTSPLVKGQPDKHRNVQVPDSEAAAVAIHPGTGEVVYCFDRPDKPLPDHWKQQGFQKVQFNHFRDLERFCRQTGQVNDIEGDWAHDEGFFEEQYAKQEKLEMERVERYMEEREKVMRAFPELRRK